jgi:hypothetical protein
MTDRLKRILPAAVWRFVRASGTALLTPFRFSHRTGHWRSSWRGLAVDHSGEPIPWYTFPAIAFLASRDFTGRSVLEIGGGQSTRWWARRASRVVTIEEDEQWRDVLAASLPDGVELHHVPVDLVGRSVDGIRKVLSGQATRCFDVIVIDGHLRREASRLAFGLLAPGGAIILDNAEGYGFFDELQEHACARMDFFGYAPGVIRPHTTSIVWVDHCFLFDRKHPMPSEL